MPHRAQVDLGQKYAARGRGFDIISPGKRRSLVWQMPPRITVRQPHTLIWTSASFELASLSTKYVFTSEHLWLTSDFTFKANLAYFKKTYGMYTNGPGPKMKWYKSKPVPWGRNMKGDLYVMYNHGKCPFDWWFDFASTLLIRVSGKRFFQATAALTSH